MVKTCNTRKTHGTIRVPAVIRTWGRRDKTRNFSGQSRSEHGHRTPVTRWYHGKYRLFSGLSLISLITDFSAYIALPYTRLDVVSRV